MKSEAYKKHGTQRKVCFRRIIFVVKTILENCNNTFIKKYSQKKKKEYIYSISLMTNCDSTTCLWWTRIRSVWQQIKASSRHANKIMFCYTVSNECEMRSVGWLGMRKYNSRNIIGISEAQMSATGHQF